MIYVVIRSFICLFVCRQCRCECVLYLLFIRVSTQLNYFLYFISCRLQDAFSVRNVDKFRRVEDGTTIVEVLTIIV